MRKPCLAWFIAGALALGSSVAAQAQSAGAMTQLPEGACLALSAAIPPSVIGLPTSGAVIDSATLHGPSDVTVTERAPTPASRVTPAAPATCRVLGRIAPVDPAAPPIRFQVNLPVQWNGKAVQFGGGGFNGVLITGLGLVPAAPYNKPGPLAQEQEHLGG